jgi:8-amino-7-oxononanoate synthase
MIDRDSLTHDSRSPKSNAQRFSAQTAPAGDSWVQRVPSLEQVGEGRVRIAGRELIALCANDYLGLAVDPRVISAASNAMAQYGFGARGGRKQVADSSLHRELEERLADLKGTESCLLFSSAYMCNVGVIDALVGPGDAVCTDEYNHPSIDDGCRLSGAEVRIYPHSDVGALASVVGEPGPSTTLVVTDSVFSMHGDVAPIAQVRAIAARAGALLLVDDSHALGVLGSAGAGAVVGGDMVDMIVGSLGKALGSVGGFIAGAADLIDFLAARTRTFSFDTALPPPAVAAALAALQIMTLEPERIERLHANAEAMRDGLRGLGYSVDTNGSAIIPLHFQTLAAAEGLSQLLWDEGVLVRALDSTYLPGGNALIRVMASAAHTRADVALVLAAFASAGERLPSSLH